jgi:hypothetical protein
MSLLSNRTVATAMVEIAPQEDAIDKIQELLNFLVKEKHRLGEEVPQIGKITIERLCSGLHDWHG